MVSLLDVQLLETVWKFALRICSNSYLAEYEELLELFDIPSLENRRLFLSGFKHTTFVAWKSSRVYVHSYVR